MKRWCAVRLFQILILLLNRRSRNQNNRRKPVRRLAARCKSQEVKPKLRNSKAEFSEFLSFGFRDLLVAQVQSDGHGFADGDHHHPQQRLGFPELQLQHLRRWCLEMLATCVSLPMKPIHITVLLAMLVGAGAFADSSGLPSHFAAG